MRLQSVRINVTGRRSGDLAGIQFALAANPYGTDGETKGDPVWLDALGTMDGGDLKTLAFT